MEYSMNNKGLLEERGNHPRGGINYIAYVSSDHMGDTCEFTSHRTHRAAEKKYGDLGRYYRGSSNSDFELIILSIPKVCAMISKEEIIWVDWDKKVIHWG